MTSLSSWIWLSSVFPGEPPSPSAWAWSHRFPGDGDGRSSLWTLDGGADGEQAVDEDGVVSRDFLIEDLEPFEGVLNIGSKACRFKLTSKCWSLLVGREGSGEGAVEQNGAAVVADMPMTPGDTPDLPTPSPWSCPWSSSRSPSSTTCLNSGVEEGPSPPPRASLILVLDSVLEISIESGVEEGCLVNSADLKEQWFSNCSKFVKFYLSVIIWLF